MRSKSRKGHGRPNRAPPQPTSACRAERGDSPETSVGIYRDLVDASRGFLAPLVYDEHVPVRVIRHATGRRAQHMVPSFVTVAPDDDQIYVQLSCGFEDYRGRLSDSDDWHGRVEVGSALPKLGQLCERKPLQVRRQRVFAAGPGSGWEFWGDGDCPNHV